MWGRIWGRSLFAAEVCSLHDSAPGNMHESVNSRVRKAARSGIMFGGAFAALALARAIPGAVTGRASPLLLVEGPLAAFAIFGGAAFLLLVTGAAINTTNSVDPKVSRWFAWLVAGAVAAFFLGFIVTMSTESPFRWGGVAAGLWAAVVLLAWGASRLSAR